MAFIAKGDLLTYILLDELDEITRGDDTLVDQAIDAAIQEMRAYLYDVFDVDDIFGQTGSARHQLLVNYACDITIYLLVARLQAGQDIEQRRLRYKRAVDWMKAVTKTETYSDLPRREETKQAHIVTGSNLKRNNYF